MAPPAANTFRCPCIRAAAEADPDVACHVLREHERQRHSIELIASENFVSRAVLEIQGSVLTNKYAEGYPGRRYYGGCTHVDAIEILAIERAKALFGCAYANVQPHSGSQANQAVYLALLQAGRHHPGLGIGRRRPFDAWCANEHLGQMVSRHRLRRAAGRPSCRHEGGGTTRARTSSKTHHRWRLGVLADTRFRRHSGVLPTRSARY